jgi:hypothetical protein
MTNQYKPVGVSSEAREPDALLSPERAMLAETLMQAIREIINSETVGKHSSAKHYGKLATLWVEDDAESLAGGFSFIEVCDYLGLSPHAIRRAIKEKRHLREFQQYVGCSLRGLTGFAWRRRVNNDTKD